MTSSANQIVSKLSLHGCCTLSAAGDEDVPEHSLCSGAELRVLSKRYFAPNCHCGDETPPLISYGLSRKRGKDTGCNIFVLPKKGTVVYCDSFKEREN